VTGGELIAGELDRLNLGAVLPVLGLLLARILPLSALSPVFGGDVVPAQVKLGFSLLLSFVLYPGVAAESQAVGAGAVLYVALLVKELLVGLCLAMLASTVFEALRVGGGIIDQLIGNVSSQLELPEEHQPAPLLANLHFQLAVTLFLTLGGHRYVLDALSLSLQALPLHRFPTFEVDGGRLLPLLLTSFSDVFRIAISLAAPSMVAAFLSDVTLGVVNRVAPQIQLFFLSMALKPLVALVALLLALPFLTDRVGGELAGWLGRLIQGAGVLS